MIHRPILGESILPTRGSDKMHNIRYIEASINGPYLEIHGSDGFTTTAVVPPRRLDHASHQLCLRDMVISPSRKAVDLCNGEELFRIKGQNTSHLFFEAHLFLVGVGFVECLEKVITEIQHRVRKFTTSPTSPISEDGGLRRWNPSI